MTRYVYMLLREDRGDGFHRLDASAVHAYSTYEAAYEDWRRMLFPGYSVVAVPIFDNPQILRRDKKEE